VVRLVRKVPVALYTWTVTPERGAAVAALVTRPEIRPPRVSAKSMAEVVAPAVTAMGVPVVTVQGTQGRSSNSSSTYPAELKVRAK
jgi:hypothetical protein